VAVDEETWQAFRETALVRGIPVSVYLGKHVRSEVARRHGTSATGIDLSLPEQIKRSLRYMLSGPRSTIWTTLPAGSPVSLSNTAGRGRTWARASR